MPRIGCNRWKHSLFVICFFLIGFILGLCYLQTILPNYCSSISYYPKPVKVHIQSPLFYNHFQYRTIETCRNETSKIFLTIAVLSSYERLTDYLPAILETWILTTTIEIEVIIFIEEKSFYTEEYIKKQFFKLNPNKKFLCNEISLYILSTSNIMDITFR
jgi:hypothetical protein